MNAIATDVILVNPLQPPYPVVLLGCIHNFSPVLVHNRLLGMLADRAQTLSHPKPWLTKEQAHD